MTDEARITELLQPDLNDGQFYVVAIQVAGRRGGRLKVTVLLDSDVGITIDECAQISRRLGVRLDEIDFFGPAPFTLEVSSPGIDQPLTFRRQYLKNIGRRLNVTLMDGDGQAGPTMTGVLVSVGEDEFVLEVDPPKKVAKGRKKPPTDSVSDVLVTPPLTGLQTLRFDQVKRTIVEVSF